ncbi:hypothetical protein GW7_14919 [Heterocephalus glaber]|uniref:Uncharacterized protein n=1 Tax=Heterocephalus glaber TaxID=10181 RepID=G5BX04_HETGA|nr:hypothetical protein GW7_14919 [Heterocephalus glaber]
MGDVGCGKGGPSGLARQDYGPKVRKRAEFVEWDRKADPSTEQPAPSTRSK